MEENINPEQETSVQNQPAPVRTSWKRFFLEVIETLVLAALLYFAIDSVMARVRVENISMKPTLQPGEFLLVNKLAYRWSDIQYMDIIVFQYPLDTTQDYIKRVIGLPGDVVHIENGIVTVNGNPLDEPYLNAPPNYTGEWVVPENTVFVLGDNRNQSSDSHNWGFVPYENIIGRALLIYWPFNEFEVLSHPQIVRAETVP